jgi:hypothetical protein
MKKSLVKFLQTSVYPRSNVYIDPEILSNLYKASTALAELHFGTPVKSICLIFGEKARL